MKLSVWQQFSSNHSNSFTIIGQFASEVEAIESGKRLEKLLDTMLKNSERNDAKEALKAQLERLGLAWQHDNLPDWLKLGLPRIERYENILFLSHGYNWSSPKPLDLLLDKLGSKSTASDSESGGINSRWTCELDILDASQADTFESLVLDIMTMDIEEFYERLTDFPTDMMRLMWRDEPKDGDVVFKRNQAHFSISNARFNRAFELHDSVSYFSVWLEACGASNIQYSVKNKPS